MITIITPAYNADKFIYELYLNIKPILKNGINWIIVNDYSTDNTFSILNEISSIEKNITVFHLDKNYGPHYARFFGIKNAKTELVFLLDSDDLLYKDDLTDFIEFAFINRSYDYYYAPTKSIKCRTEFLNSTNITTSQIVEINKPTDFIFHEFPNQSSLIIRKKFYIDNYQQINLPWGEDMFLYLVLSQHGSGIMWKKPVSCYIISGLGRGSNLSYSSRFKLFLALFKQSLSRKKVNSILYSIYLSLRYTSSYIYKKFIA